MNKKEYIISLKDGSSCIVEFSEKTNFIDETNDFVVFKNGMIRRDEIISVIHLNEKKENDYIDDTTAYAKFMDKYVSKTGKLVEASLKELIYPQKLAFDIFKNIEEDKKIDVDGLGITITSGNQGIKLTNENISSFEIKQDGTIKAPKINFIKGEQKMESKNYIIKLKDGNSFILQSSKYTASDLSSYEDFVRFYGGFVKREEIVYVLLKQDKVEFN